MNNIIKVAASSPKIKVADPISNKDEILKAIKEADKLGCELLVLPELCLSGYSCQDLFYSECLINNVLDSFNQILLQTKNTHVTVVIGLPMYIDGNLCIARAVIRLGEVLELRVKKPTLEEMRWFSVPDNSRTDQSYFEIEINGHKLIVDPCADICDYTKDRSDKVKMISFNTMSCIISSSASSSESTTDVVYNGYCGIAKNGIVLAENKGYDDNSLTVFNVDMSLSTSAKTQIAKTSELEKNPFLPSHIDFNTACERILNIQAYALKKRFEHTFSKTAVIGISGGLDSTLALLATVRAFDLMNKSRKDIICVTMPCFGTTERTKSNAVRLCEELNVDIREINIKNAVLQHFSDIGHDANTTDVTYENSQARERTQVIMDIANRYNGLVIGTGDMSELALGWATYNGDHMSMYGINASITKTMVRSIVNYEAERLGNEVGKILFDILNTPVSPELLPADSEGKIAQKTEDLVGPYELHDFFLYHFLKNHYSPSKIYSKAKAAFENEYDDETIKKWLKTFFRRFVISQFKRSCVPDGPKVGVLSLSPRTSLKMPSDSSYSVFLNEINKL